MKSVAKVLLILVSTVFLFYLALPSPDFPTPPPDSFRSVEPADSETEERRAYFTNFTREQVQDYYREQYTLPYGLDFLTIKLIHPPEDAYPLIRDQTRSTHLVEFVHPLRGSLYINEFVAKAEKDDIWYKAVHYDQKITVKIVQNSVWVRLVVGALILVLVWLLAVEWLRFIPDFVRELHKLQYVFKD